MVTNRTSIPIDLAADILFKSDNTCCVCRERGKAVQLHHIDENPSNNTPENLSVLCLECHNNTQIKGGFGRKLNAELVIKYRDEWFERVTVRRGLADEMAVKGQVLEGGIRHQVEQKAHAHSNKNIQPNSPPLSFINSLPTYRALLTKQAQPKLNTGVTSTVVQANYDYIDALNGILIALAHYCSPAQFGNQTAHEYFSEIIASRFRWHRTIAEPYGPGTGGTIVNIICSKGVVSDVEKMVEDMVMALVGYDDDFDWKGWPKRWREEEI
jgi:hypothetical protein